MEIIDKYLKKNENPVPPVLDTAFVITFSELFCWFYKTKTKKKQEIQNRLLFFFSMENFKVRSSRYVIRFQTKFFAPA